MENKRPKIGLALGCGGTRGYAHIGVIKALENNKIPIDFIVGSSAGAMLGSHYALFKSIQKLEKLVLSTNWRQVFSLIDFSFRGGVIKGMRIEEFISEHLKDATFSQMKIPFKIVATNFKNGETVELSEGKVAPAVQASMSVPLFFKPVLHQNKLLFDGGISNPVPVNEVKRMGADIVIAVNLINKSFFSKKSFIEKNYSAPQRPIYFLHYNLAKRCLKSADFIIEPKAIDLGFKGIPKLLKEEGRKMILEGERSTRLVLPKIKRLIHK